MRGRDAWTSAIAAAAAAVATFLLVAPPGAAGAARSTPASSAVRRVLDERRADFREDEDPSRVIAALGATLVREDGVATLSISASAIGPRVDPPPGAEGVRGANLIAAEEIQSILARGRAEVRVVRSASGAGRGRALPGRVGELVERRLLADGRVEHVAAGDRPRIVEAVFEAPVANEGDFAVEILVDGHVRARATGSVGLDGGRIDSLEGVAEHPPKETRP